MQQALLKILERSGVRASAGELEHPHQVPVDRHHEHPLPLRRLLRRGSEKIISRRIGKNQVGFGAEIRFEAVGGGAELLSQVMPELPSPTASSPSSSGGCRSSRRCIS